MALGPVVYIRLARKGIAFFDFHGLDSFILSIGLLFQATPKKILPRFISYVFFV